MMSCKCPSVSGALSLILHERSRGMPIAVATSTVISNISHGPWPLGRQKLARKGHTTGQTGMLKLKVLALERLSLVTGITKDVRHWESLGAGGGGVAGASCEGVGLAGFAPLQELTTPINTSVTHKARRHPSSHAARASFAPLAAEIPALEGHGPSADTAGTSLRGRCSESSVAFSCKAATTGEPLLGACFLTPTLRAEKPETTFV
mmetsp:Transcript_39427/g.91444  ORF Transcript_39427/g.91444 Transcript_39427/m.91444 type:complete len:206 (-) Transcript_39427:140-757(-)